MNIRLSSVSTFLLAGLFGVGLALAPMSGAEPREPVERDRVEREFTPEREEREQSETAQREELESLGAMPEEAERVERDRVEREELDDIREEVDVTHHGDHRRTVLELLDRSERERELLDRSDRFEQFRDRFEREMAERAEREMMEMIRWELERDLAHTRR